MEHRFSEKDKEMLIEFLNLVAQKAKFEMDTNEIIKYFKALSYMQQTLVPKVDRHILEVVRVVEQEPEEKPKKKRTSKKK